MPITGQRCYRCCVRRVKRRNIAPKISTVRKAKHGTSWVYGLSRVESPVPREKHAGFGGEGAETCTAQAVITRRALTQQLNKAEVLERVALPAIHSAADGGGMCLCFPRSERLILSAGFYLRKESGLAPFLLSP